MDIGAIKKFILIFIIHYYLLTIFSFVLRLNNFHFCFFAVLFVFMNLIKITNYFLITRSILLDNYLLLKIYVLNENDRIKYNKAIVNC